MTARPAARAGRPALALFLLFAGFYLLTGSGHFYSVDEETLYLVTESLVERRTFALPPDGWGIVASEQPTDGPVYAQYGPGQSLLAVPLYLLGRAAAPLFPADGRGYLLRLFVGLLGPLVTAGTVALLYRLARALGYRGGAALGVALIYGLATLAWPHGRTFFAEPLTALLLLTAFYYARRGTEPGAEDGAGAALLVASGAAAMLAVATKLHAALALPVLAVYLIGRAAGQEAGPRQWREAMRRALVWGVGIALVALPYAAFNAALYGAPWRTGYSSGRLTGYAAPFLTGLYGLTLSSGKGLLWYAPPVALAIAGWPAFFRRHRAEALACLGIALANLAFYSRLTIWHGDWAWGPRYLAVMLPFAVLPLVALLERLRPREHRVAAALVAAVVTLGVVVQLLGVLVNFVWYLAHSYDDADRAQVEATRHFSPRASPLVVHAHLLAERVAEWRERALPPGDTAVLGGGFSLPEGGTAGPLLPRWTTGAGEIALHSAAREPLVVRLTFFDHRPPALRLLPPTVLVDGAPLPEGAIDRHDFSGTGEGWTYQFTVPAEALRRDRASVTLRSATWNPRAAGHRERDEELGVFVHRVEVWRAGKPFAVQESAAMTAGQRIPPVPPRPRDFYRWFNDDRAFEGAAGAPVHHLVDLWMWYATVGGLGRARASAWIAAYAACAGASFFIGAALLARSLPAGTLSRRWRIRPGRESGRDRPSPARPGKQRRGRSRPV